MNCWWCTDYDDKQLETRMTNFENWINNLSVEDFLRFIHYPMHYCPIDVCNVKGVCFSKARCFSKECQEHFKAWGEKEIEE